MRSTFVLVGLELLAFWLAARSLTTGQETMQFEEIKNLLNLDVVHSYIILRPVV